MDVRNGSGSLFVVRHAEYEGRGDNSLSALGREQALSLAEKICEKLLPGEVTIWASTAKRAVETAEIIKSFLEQHSKEVLLVAHRSLWSDENHLYRLNLLADMVRSHEGNNLVIVTDLEYVEYFPNRFGFSAVDPDYAEGVCIQNGKKYSIKHSVE